METLEVQRSKTIYMIMEHMLGVGEMIGKGVKHVATKAISAVGQVATSVTTSAASASSQQSAPATPIASARKRKTLNLPDLWSIWSQIYGESVRGACKLCETTQIMFANRSGENGWEVSHVIPVCSGGSDEPSNLRPLCRNCNRSMGGKDFRTYINEKYPNRLDQLVLIFNL